MKQVRIRLTKFVKLISNPYYKSELYFYYLYSIPQSILNIGVDLVYLFHCGRLILITCMKVFSKVDYSWYPVLVE